MGKKEKKSKEAAAEPMEEDAGPSTSGQGSEVGRAEQGGRGFVQQGFAVQGRAVRRGAALPVAAADLSYRPRCHLQLKERLELQRTRVICGPELNYNVSCV